MAAATDLGPLVLAGSGEYTPTMEIVDRYLVKRLEGRSVLLIATACAPEGDDVMTRWEEMGMAHFQRQGVSAEAVRIRDRAEADVAEHADRIVEAGIVWFSGGRAAYLAQAFVGTRAWQALEAANRRGAAVAGSSGGLGVLNQDLPDATIEGPQPPTGLGLAAPVRAMAHFNRMEARRPEMVERTVGGLAAGQMAVGVDEDTAIVWTESAWQVMGHKRAVVYQSTTERLIFRPGDRIDILPPPLRAAPPPAPESPRS